MRNLEEEMPTELSSQVGVYIPAEAVLFCPGASPMIAGPNEYYFFFKQNPPNIPVKVMRDVYFHFTFNNLPWNK